MTGLHKIRVEGIEMTNQTILETALLQSAIDETCDASDFLSGQNKIVYSKPHPKARKYLELPFSCNLVSYGNQIVASISPEIEAEAAEYIGRYPVEHCFETPHLLVLDGALQKKGLRVCFMAEYFLPDVRALSPLPCGYRTKWLFPADFEGLYGKDWGNALCAQRKNLDRMGIGAYDGERLVGLAACSADCDTMWQIGVDVLPAYRNQGVASALTSRLGLAILEQGKVPFYCAAWSNIKSVRNAIRSGFRPAWVEMTSKPEKEVRWRNGLAPAVEVKE